MSSSILRQFARVIFLATIVFGLSAAAAHAQALFEPVGGANSLSSIVAAGNTPQGVAVADFNHDGLQDMVIANHADNTIKVYLASAPGKFNTPATYPTGGGPDAILAMDLNGDGLPDIVVTCNSPTANVIEVFLNLGNGTFSLNPSTDPTTNIVLGTGINPVAIASADFNGDNHPDLAVANRGSGSVTLFLSDASSNFTTYVVQTITGLGTPSGIAAGSFTGTGHADFAVTDATANVVHVVLGDGTGNFINYGTVAAGTDPEAIAVGDWDHNGTLDIATQNAGDGTASILSGQGNGSFTLSATVPTTYRKNTKSKSLAAVDINGDGYLDLVAANYISGSSAFGATSTVSVLMNRGNGQFAGPQFYAVPSGAAYVTVGDFNRDGKPDLAVTQANAKQATVLINNTLATPIPGGRNYGGVYDAGGFGNMADSITVADFNGDGQLDMAIAYLQDNAIRVLTGKGNGQFNPAVVYPVGTRPYSVVSGDLNRDGHPDLAVVNTGDNTISVLLNNGSGAFSAPVTYPVGHIPYQAAIGDINGDGIPDIAVTNYGDNTVSVLYGQAGGTFVAGPVLTTGINPYGVAIGDLNRTGHNSIAVTCYKNAQLYVFLNNGGGSFQSPEIYGTDLNPAALVLGDFNRDGNVDIVTGNSIGNDISFFAGNGNGSFKAGVVSQALNFPVGIAAGDINGDGILDIVASAPNFNMATVLLGKGDGTFLPRLDFPTEPQPWAVALADFNHDGKLDIATANTYNRVNLAIPAYQIMYEQKFPPIPSGHRSVNRLYNTSGTNMYLTTAFVVSPGSPTMATLTAHVDPRFRGLAPTGTVTFEDGNGSILLGSAPVSAGEASLTTTLSAGSHFITLLYSGDAYYQPNTASGFFLTNPTPPPPAAVRR